VWTGVRPPHRFATLAQVREHAASGKPDRREERYMADQQSTRRAEVRKEGDREIVTERIFDAPRDLVFRAYTDPELVPEWWGPRGTETVVDRMDARTGGDWRFVHRDSDGSETAFRGTFREISPPERIAQTFEWDGMPGYVSVDIAGFEDLGGRTRVRTRSLFHLPEERDGMLDAGMESGLQESYDRLDEVLERIAAT
jgi:uncharacterized protein YndB with AHSA1/START domain